MKMDETPKKEKKGYGIYRMLDAVKSKLPEDYKNSIYNGIYIGLKSDYVRFIVDPSRDNRMQFFMLFVKDSDSRSDKYDGGQYLKSNQNVWFYLCSGFNKFELLDLNVAIRRELYSYINTHNIVCLDYYNEKMFREEKIFYFDDSQELHGNNKYEKYVEAFKNKYTNN